MSWKNKIGTADRACSCGSWKNHWIKFSKSDWPKSCVVLFCSNNPTVGAHVINVGVIGEKIIPMCDSCNKLQETFYLKSDVIKVSANQSITCGS